MKRGISKKSPITLVDYTRNYVSTYSNTTKTFQRIVKLRRYQTFITAIKILGSYILNLRKTETIYRICLRELNLKSCEVNPSKFLNNHIQLETFLYLYEG